MKKKFLAGITALIVASSLLLCPMTLAARQLYSNNAAAQHAYSLYINAKKKKTNKAKKTAKKTTKNSSKK